MTLLALMASQPAAAQDVPAGADIPDAVSLQVTPEGLDAFGALVPALAPDATPVADTSGGSSCFGYGIYGVEVGFTFNDVRILPQTGVLQVEADLDVYVNSAGAPFELDLSVFCLDSQCPSWVRPFPVTARLPFSMAVVQDPLTGDRVIDATLGTIEVVNGLDNSDIELSGDCSLLDNIDDVLGQVGLSPLDFIISVVNPFITSTIQDSAADIELALEDALSAARYEDSLSLSGVDLDVLVEPFRVAISPDGLEMVMLGNLSAEPAACIADRDPGQSAGVVSDIPNIAANPPGTELMVQASDEFANQGLYAIWRGGLLCYEIGADSGLSLPVPLNSSLLGVLGGPAWDEILPLTEEPIAIVTDPRAPPEAVFDAGHDLVAAVTDLGVDLYTAIDFRQTRAVGLTLDADVPVDLVFDAQTGDLHADVGLTADVITAVVTHNELVPESSAEIASSFTGLMDVLVDSLVGDALGGIQFSVPAFNGVGLTSLTAEPTGGGDWLGVSATVGVVPYGGGGGCGGGCGGGGGGCSSAGGRGALGLFLLVPLWVRRRRA